MIDLLAWLGLASIIMQLWNMGSGNYKAGWWWCLVGCVAWAGYAIALVMWPLGLQQIVIAVLAVRGLKNL